MILLLSPAKAFACDRLPTFHKTTEPYFLDQVRELVEVLRGYAPFDLQGLYKVSEKVADLNFGRYQRFPDRISLETGAKQAVLSFFGDAYRGLGVEDFSSEDLDYLQDRLRILSGLYGLLRPLDLMMEYRLEMGTKLKIGEAKNLYEYWGDRLTDLLNQTLEAQKSSVVVNLASKEYFSALNPARLKAQIVTPVFKEFKKGEYKVVSIYAKRARGLMVRSVVKNRVTNVEDLQLFAEEDYRFNPDLSGEDEWVFCRG